MQNRLSKLVELLKQKKNYSLLEKTRTRFLCSSLLEICVQKFKVNFFGRFRAGARQVLTTKKPLPTKIPLTMKIVISNSL